MICREYIAYNGTPYVYAGRMLRSPGTAFATRGETAVNVALAHQILGTPKDAWHPNIIFREPHEPRDLPAFLFGLVFGGNLVDVWIARASLPPRAAGAG